MMYGRGGYNYATPSGMGWFGGVMMLLFWALILAGIVLLVMWAVRASAGHGSSGGAMPPQPGATGHHEAVAIAKRRLASGEITNEQYLEIMRALGEKG